MLAIFNKLAKQQTYPGTKPYFDILLLLSVLSFPVIVLTVDREEMSLKNNEASSEFLRLRQGVGRFRQAKRCRDVGLGSKIRGNHTKESRLMLDLILFPFLGQLYYGARTIIIQKEMLSNLSFDLPSRFYSLEHFGIEQLLPAIDYDLLSREESEQRGEYEELRPLSIKKPSPAFQISFEKDFMKEHLQVFKEIYARFKEFLRTETLSHSKKSALEGEGTRTELGHPSLNSLLSHTQHSISPEHQKQFLKDLSRQQKLHDFLSLAVNSADYEDGLKLVLVARQVWLQFVPHQREEFQVRDLIRMGKELAEGKIRSQFWQMFANGLQYERVLQPLSEFLCAYCTTILLTVLEFFQNPFHLSGSLDKGKRALVPSVVFSIESLDDFELEAPPTKKRKSSQ